MSGVWGMAEGDAVVGARQGQVLARVMAWAGENADVRAMALVGSSARAEHGADAWSDLDLILVVRDARTYLRATDWLLAIGTPWVHTVERNAAGEVVERRVLFEGGVDVDFLIVDARDAAQRVRTGQVAEIVRRGMRVLLDLDGVLSAAAIPAVEEKTVPPPQPAFLEVVHDFWFHAAWTAKKLRRGELWTAKSGCDVYMKDLLLRMVVWHAGVTRGWDVDTWYGGRFVEQWAVPWVVEALGDVFAHYEVEDLWRALAATMRLFRQMSIEAAACLGYVYPEEGERQVRAWVERCSAERKELAD